MTTGSNIHCELGDRVQGLGAGGIGAMLLTARRTGLIGDIYASLHLLKVHLTYYESDHVLNIPLNVVAVAQPPRIPADHARHCATRKIYAMLIPHRRRL